MVRYASLAFCESELDREHHRTTADALSQFHVRTVVRDVDSAHPIIFARNCQESGCLSKTLELLVTSSTSDRDDSLGYDRVISYHYTTLSQ